MPVTEGEPDSGYLAYDPADVLPQLATDPPPSSTAPGDGGSLPGTNVGTQPNFDERFVEDFNGLMFLGALTKTFSWVGHKFRIRTLTSGEYLVAGQLMVPYQGTIGEARAYVTALVALCIMEVDGQPLPTPVQTHADEIAWAHQRFTYVKGHWFSPVIDIVYNEFLVLEARAKAVLDEMGKASGWSGPSTPGSGENSGSPSVEDSSASQA